METLAQIHNDVVFKLKEHPDRVKQRREAIRALVRGMEKTIKPTSVLRRRKAWFSTTQSQVTIGKAAANVQLLGLNVGQVLFDRGEWWFLPIYQKFPEYTGKRWKWSDNTEDAEAIRNFLESCARDASADAEDEREIQWRLAYAFQRDEGNELRFLQPVTWNGYFNEVGVSITREGEIGTGNVDLLVRCGHGNNRGFLVVEVKRPGEAGFEASFRQAVRYATALEIEANGGEIWQGVYRKAFGAGGINVLKIGAVVAMDGSCFKKRERDEALRSLAQCCSEPGESKIKWIGALLYRLEGDMLKFEWLRHWTLGLRRGEGG